MLAKEKRTLFECVYILNYFGNSRNNNIQIIIVKSVGNLIKHAVNVDEKKKTSGGATESYVCTDFSTISGFQTCMMSSF